MKTKNIMFLLACAVMFIFSAQVQAEKVDHFNHNKRKAAKGYDVVSYFSDKPEKGRKAITAEYMGLNYYFASRANLVKFQADPGKYAPQYGGWCATAMADGKKVDINPKSYKITDGKLYLFYKTVFANAKKGWDKNEAELTSKADAAWAKIIGS